MLIANESTKYKVLVQMLSWGGSTVSRLQFNGYTDFFVFLCIFSFHQWIILQKHFIQRALKVSKNIPKKDFFFPYMKGNHFQSGKHKYDTSD